MLVEHLFRTKHFLNPCLHVQDVAIINFRKIGAKELKWIVDVFTIRYHVECLKQGHERNSGHLPYQPLDFVHQTMGDFPQLFSCDVEMVPGHAFINEPWWRSMAVWGT